MRPKDNIDANNAATQTTPGAIVLSVSLSGPMPSGNKLTTIMKKNNVARTSARRRHARIRSRHTSQANIDWTEAFVTTRVAIAGFWPRPDLNPDALLRSRCHL